MVSARARGATISALTLAEMKMRLPLQDVEMCGVIGSNWFTCLCGAGDSAPFCDALFTWHSHVSGNPMFSLDDIVIFMYSAAATSDLFVPDGIALIIKTDTAWKLRRRLREGLVLAQGCPLLSMQIVLQRLSTLTQMDLLEAPVFRLCHRFGLKMLMEYTDDSCTCS